MVNQELLEYEGSKTLITPTSFEPLISVSEVEGQVFKTGAINQMTSALQRRFFKQDPDWAQFAPNLVPVDILFRLGVHDEDWYVQAPATAALKSLALGQPTVLQFFYQRLRHPDPDARSHAAHALGEIARREPEVLDGEVIERAVGHLAEMGDRDACNKWWRS